ncbi:hypothetical protein V8D89_013413 [Ganoderma adspersum]
MFSSILRRAPSALRRPLSTSSPSSFHTWRQSTSIPRLSPRLLTNQLPVRGAASSVSGRPGSQTLEHAAENIREEVGHSAADLAKSIAGGNVYTDNVEPAQQTFLGITNAVAHAVPIPYVVFGLAGGIPYVCSSGVTVYLAWQAGLAAQGLISSIDPGVAITVLHQALDIQTTYGAVMLSFLGALHWGFEFAGYGGHKYYPRLLLGAAPVVYGWSTLALDPMGALIAQWIGFTTMWWADLRATTAGWTPKWYSQYRFYLSVMVGTCIIGSLFATSVWGPVGGHGLISHDLNMIRAERKKRAPEGEGLVHGEVEAVAAPEDSDHYVVVKKHENEGGEGNGNGQKQQ